MKLEFTNSCREVVSVALYHQQHTITTDSLRLLVATAINQAHRLHSSTQRMLKEGNLHS